MRKHFLPPGSIAAVAFLLGAHTPAVGQTPGLENLLPVESACGVSSAIPVGSDSPEALVTTLYSIVSGPPGAPKNWDALRLLHAPGARITPTRHLKDGTFAAAPGDVEAFIRLNQSLFANRGFYEREIARRVEQFGHIAHVMSTYESSEHPDSLPYGRGVNSFQLLNDGKRWCVLSATWDSDIPQHPIPTRYLPQPSTRKKKGGALGNHPDLGYTRSMYSDIVSDLRVSRLGRHGWAVVTLGCSLPGCGAAVRYVPQKHLLHRSEIVHG